MKKSILFFIVTLLISCTSIFGQKLKQNEVDKFTKKTIKTTSWETLIGGGGMTSLMTNFRIKKVDETVWFELKMMMSGKIYSIREKDQIIFLFEDNSTVTLYNHESTVTCKGCGAPGFVGSDGYGTHTYYLLSADDIAALKKNKIVGIRIYNSDSYVERDAKNVSKVLLKCFSLVEI